MKIKVNCSFCGKTFEVEHYLSWARTACKECLEEHKDDIRPIAYGVPSKN